MTGFTLKDLEAIIAARTATSAEASYTRSLLEKRPGSLRQEDGRGGR